MPEEATPAAETEATPTPEQQSGGETPDLSAELEKWKAMARQNEKQAKANADAARRLAEMEESEKSELDKLTGKLTDSEKRAAAAESAALRLEVAMEKAPDGMSLAQLRKLANRLQGSSREELETDADELFAEFVSEPPKSPPGDLPKQKLKASNDPESPPEIDYDAVAKKILGR